MDFKKGNQWKCGFDPEKGLYTAQIGYGVNCTLYEISKEIMKMLMSLTMIGLQI